MQTYISLLRGINVSGQKKIRMDELKALYQSLGYSGVQTFIQSGNVIFDADGSMHGERIEATIAKHYGFKVSVLLRTANELSKIIENNPFVRDRDADKSSLHVVFLSKQPDLAALAMLSANG